MVIATIPGRQPAPQVEGDAQAQTGRTADAWRVLQGVMDPEIPVLSLVDLGIVREVRDGRAEPGDDETLQVTLTPTYSGCPATEVIETDVRTALEAAGLGPVRLARRLAPAWSTDWISAEGRERLRAYGIAPPGHAAADAPVAVLHLVPRAAAAVGCPRCGSADTERLSPFGSTACKALYRCRACREPFEHFKPI